MRDRYAGLPVTLETGSRMKRGLTLLTLSHEHEKIVRSPRLKASLEFQDCSIKGRWEDQFSIPSCSLTSGRTESLQNRSLRTFGSSKIVRQTPQNVNSRFLTSSSACGIPIELSAKDLAQASVISCTGRDRHSRMSAIQLLTWRGHEHLLDAVECAFEPVRRFRDAMSKMLSKDEARGDAQPDLHTSQESTLHVNGSSHIHVQHRTGTESPDSSSSRSRV